MKNLQVTCPTSDGIEVVKSSLLKMQELGESKKLKVDLHYLGAPKYRVSLVAADYKTAEAVFGEMFETLEKALRAQKGEAVVVK